MGRKILLLAGEESGCNYARRIAATLRAREPGVEIRGYDSYGFLTEDLGVWGIWEVVRRIFYFLRVKRTLERAIVEWCPDVVCTIDYPGLNLKLAAFAHERGIRAVHVVCPQVWAWHQGRIPKIEASLDRLCCFLPFEPKIFREGFATFVGHPLIEEFADKRLSADKRQRGVLAVLPGSRLGEVNHHLRDCLKAARRLQAQGLVKSVVIPAANDRAYAAIAKTVARADAALAPIVEVTRGGARDVLRGATAAVVASGTATLEAALIGVPTVLVYRVSWLLGEFLKRAIKGTRFAGLANVIWERCGGKGGQPMPELLQDDFTVAAVAAKLEPWLADERANAGARAVLAETVQLMSVDGKSIDRIVDCL